MDDLDPTLKDDDELDSAEEDDFMEEDPLLPKKKGQKESHDEMLSDEPESLDALADEEDGLLPEDSFDDTDEW